MNEPSNPNNIEKLTAEILILKGQTAQNIVEIGKRLIAVKESLPHGEFGIYLKDKVDFSRQSANRFMQVTREFSNCSALSDLSSTKIFALLDLPADERETFIKENPVNEMTTRQLQQAISDKNELKRQLEVERSKPPVTVEKAIFPQDYHKIKGDLAKYEFKFKEYENSIKWLEEDKKLLERKANLNAEDAKKYNDMKKQMDFLYKQKNDLSREIESATALARASVKIDTFLKTELAPIKYSRAFEQMDSEVARENLLSILHNVEAWCIEIKSMIPDKYKRTEVF